MFAHNKLDLPLLRTAASPQVTGGGGQRLQEGAEGLELGEAETGCDLYTVEKIGEGKRQRQIYRQE